MAFKIKDLMIAVLPERGGGGAGYQGCRAGCSMPSKCEGCSMPSKCGGCSMPSECGACTYKTCDVFSCIGITGGPQTCFAAESGCGCSRGGNSCQGCSTPSCGFLGCTGGSFCAASCPGITGCNDTCPGVTLTIILRPDIPADPEGLAILKEQLKRTLTQVEIQERVIEESLKPQTIEEVEQLEKKLTEALSELRARKQELQRHGVGRQEVESQETEGSE